MESASTFQLTGENGGWIVMRDLLTLQTYGGEQAGG